MQDFLQWMESDHGITVVSYNRYGEITFSINGKRYVYSMDAGYFYNGFFKNWIKFKPGKALNFAKKHGNLISPTSDEQRTEKPKMIQGTLFPY